MHQQQTEEVFFFKKKERLYSFGDRLAAGTRPTKISSSTYYLIKVQSLLNVNGHKVGSLSYWSKGNGIDIFQIWMPLWSGRSGAFPLRNASRIQPDIFLYALPH